MTDKLPPNLLALFAPRPPLRYLPHCDHAPEARKTAPISGVAAFLEALHTPDPNYKPTESWLQRRDRIQQEKRDAQEKRLKVGLESYDPAHDQQIRGDPYKTLFVSRLSYEAKEPDLEREFGRFGPIERIRIVRDKENNKHRGYAFIVYEREKDMKAAYKETDGIRIKDRRVLVDVERGRTVKGWKPRRLGGGLGGRGYTKIPLTRPAGPAGGPGGFGGGDRFGGDRGGPRGGFRGGFRGGRGGGGGGGGFSGGNRFDVGSGRGPRGGIGFQGGGGGGRFGGRGGDDSNGFGGGEAPPNAPTGPGGRRGGGGGGYGGDRGGGDRGGFGGYQGGGSGGFDRGGDRGGYGGFDRRGGGDRGGGDRSGGDRGGHDRPDPRDRFSGGDRGDRSDRGGGRYGGDDHHRGGRGDRGGGDRGGDRDHDDGGYQRKRPHDDGGYGGGGDRHRRRY